MSSCVLGHDLPEGGVRCTICGLGALPQRVQQPERAATSPTDAAPGQGVPKTTTPPTPPPAARPPLINASSAPANISATSVRSPDGRWEWDGIAWRALASATSAPVMAGALPAAAPPPPIPAPPVTPATPAPVTGASWSTAPLAPPAALRPRRVGEGFTRAGVVAISVAIALLIAIWTTILLTTHEHHTLVAELSLSDTSLSRSPGDSCSGSDGYDDITEGAQVVVSDQSGKTLGTGVLGAGTYDGDACVFGLAVRELPKASFYKINVGREARGQLNYSLHQMKASHWFVDLTLGS